MTVDETKKPLRIPPEYGVYAEEKEIFGMLKQLMEDLVINKPADPLQHMIDWLDIDTHDAPAVIIQGRFGAGRHSVGKEVSQKLRCALITPDSLASDDITPVGQEARDLVDKVSCLWRMLSMMNTFGGYKSSKK